MKFNGMSTRDWVHPQRTMDDSTTAPAFQYSGTAPSYGSYANMWYYGGLAGYEFITAPWHGFYLNIGPNGKRDGPTNCELIEVGVTESYASSQAVVQSVIADLPVNLGQTRSWQRIFIPLELNLTAGARPLLRGMNRVASEDYRTYFQPRFKGDTVSEPMCTNYEHVSTYSNTVSDCQIVWPGSIGTKTSWTEVGRTTQRYRYIYVYVGTSDYTSTQGNRRWLVDLAVGESGSEVVIAENIFQSASLSPWSAGSCVTLPIQIPAGKRISARLQGSSSSAVYECDIQIIGFF